MEFSMRIRVSLTFKLVIIIDLTLQNHFHYLEEVTLTCASFCYFRRQNWYMYIYMLTTVQIGKQLTGKYFESR